MKRIWFTQQKPYNYIPLRMGLGDIQVKEVYNYCGNGLTFVPKLYTTRTYSLSGEYYVVEGSRFKATSVEPRIGFKVEMSCQLDLKNGLVTTTTEKCGEVWAMLPILSRDDLTFAELDLGTKGATFMQLRDELLKLNKKATIDTPFYVNKLEPL